MIEAIVAYLVVKKLIISFFEAVMLNTAAFELLFGAAVVLGILLMIASPSKVRAFNFNCVKSYFYN